MKRSFVLVLVCVLLLTLVACGHEDSKKETISSTESDLISMPDVKDTDKKTAKNILSSFGLIPTLKYEYNDETKKGNVIRTSPDEYSKVEKGSRIIVYISKGKALIESKDARISWHNISSGEDEWEFYAPYIKKNTLYIECINVKFSIPIKWKDTYKDGHIIGVASINDTFDKSVPIKAKYKKQSWDANEKQHFTLKIPLGDLNVSKPTDIYISLYTDTKDEYGNKINVNVDFTMTW